MVHKDHVALIQTAVPAVKSVWADLGSGEGAFTLALADITGSKAEIYSVDTDSIALELQRQSFAHLFPQSPVHYITADFTKPLDLPPLDGVLMANALHYVADQIPFLRTIKTHLRPGGRMVLVEYNTDHGNEWVPHPLSYKTFKNRAGEAGFHDVELVSTIPSNFLGEIYSAVCFV
jgi:ubiquinone/menaquinone biosynthesis C-methylase UbiE